MTHTEHTPAIHIRFSVVGGAFTFDETVPTSEARATIARITKTGVVEVISKEVIR